MFMKKVFLAFLISLGVSSAYAAESKSDAKKTTSSKKSKVSSKKSRKSKKAKKNPDYYDLSIIWETEAIVRKTRKIGKKLVRNSRLISN